MNQELLEKLTDRAETGTEISINEALTLLDYEEPSEDLWEALLHSLFARQIRLTSGDYVSSKKSSESRYAAEYLQMLKLAQIPDAETFETLFSGLKSGDAGVYDPLTQAFLPYIADAAARWYPETDSEIQDIVGEGVSGALYAMHHESLVEQISSADELKQMICWWIEGYMFRYLYTAACAAGISGHLADRMNMVRQVRSRLAAALDHAPTAAEIAAESGLSLQEVMTILNEIQNQQKNDALQKQLAGSKEESTAPADGQAMRRADINMAADRIGFEEELDLLDPIERYVLQSLYGFGGRMPVTAEEAARQMDMSKEEVAVIEKRALEKIKKIKGE